MFFLVCVYSCVHWPILALKPVPYLTGVYKSVNIRMMPPVSNARKCMSSTDFICVLPSSRSTMKNNNNNNNNNIALPEIGKDVGLPHMLLLFL